MKGKPIYLGLATDENKIFKLKPQNLIFNLFYGDKSHFSKNEHTRVIVKYLKKYRIKSNQGNNFDLKSNLSKKIYNKIISNYKSCIDYK